MNKIRALIVLSLGFPALAWACSGAVEPANNPGDGGLDAPLDDVPETTPEAGPDATDDMSWDGGLPRLGLYTVKTDGTGLSLLLDAGTRELSHVRLSPSGWLVATRYGKDPDGNGLSMENEIGIGAHYAGTEIVIFRREAPTAQSVVAGTVSGGTAANPSWTEDGKVIFVQGLPDAGAAEVHLARASFGALPAVASIETVATPPSLLVPVDPHQSGPSDGTGIISFTATVNLSGKWMRPVWKMPATGTSVIGSVGFVGCPICPSTGGCCGWTTLSDVLGTNDSRMSNSGSQILWMQQDPNISASVGPVTLYPYRQVMGPMDGGPQVTLPAVGTDPTTTLSYGEWRADDKEITYWSIEIAGAVLRQFLWVMSPDGSGRRKIPLPSGLCPQHPSYLGPSEIVFNAWRGGPDGTCDVAKL